MVTTRLAKKIAVKEGKVLSPLRKLPSPHRKKRGSKLAQKVEPEPEAEEEEKEEEAEAEEELQKALKENSSDSDEDEEVNEDEEQAKEEIEGFDSTDDEEETESHQIKKLPKDTKISQKDSKLEKGVIYIGRLPEGFGERELNKYFNQFGDITNIKVPRNKMTGRSKHFAFVEFSNKDDALIARETMNNYLLLNHQLKVNMVESFKQGKKFKKNFFKITKITDDLKTLNSKVDSRRNKRKESLKSSGIKF